MSPPFPAALSLLVLLAGAAAAQPATSPGEAAGAPRSITLRAKAPREVRELRISPGLVTTLLFGAPLRLMGVEVEESESFVRVRVLEDMLLLQPSGALGAGKRLWLKVRFAEGTVPAGADFVLVVDANGAERQVNVELQPEVPVACGPEVEAERLQVRQCQAELERERKRPEGLTGLLADERMDDKGISALKLKARDFTGRPGGPLKVWDVTSYRARGVVAVELKVTNLSERPWTLAGAELVGEGGVRLKVLRVWPLEPLAPGSKRRRMVVEAEATEAQARGRFTLLLWQDGEAPGVSVDGVSFP
jgi:uncharacterized protein (TIGR02268 family)